MKGLVSKFSLILFSLFLISCGGGGGNNSLPPAPTVSVDKIAPQIIFTEPYSEQANVQETSPLRITFSESITTEVKEEQVVIYRVQNDAIVGPAIQLNADNFRYKKNKFENDVLVVPFKTTDLLKSSQYRVTVKNIQDASLEKNTLLKSCTWDFTTVGAVPLTTGKKGLCGKIPDKLLNVQAFSVSENEVVISWNKPIDVNGSVSTVNYSKVERSIDGQVTFEVLTANTTEQAFSDTSGTDEIILGTSRVYKITVSNNTVGYSSQTALSNVVIAKAINPSIQAKQRVFSKNASENNNFGVPRSTAFSSDMETLAIGDSYGSIKTPIVGAGIVAGAGAVDLYSKIKGIWTYATTLISQIPTDNNGFGWNVKFSPDGQTLVISEIYGDQIYADNGMPQSDAGTVDVYTKNKSGKWVYKMTLSKQTPSISSLYGYNIALHSNIMAIAEYNGSTVDLYKKENKFWSFYKTLTSLSTPFRELNRNYFGYSMSFDLDGKTLAIGNLRGNTPTDAIEPATENAGTVDLYNADKTGVWTLTETLISRTPAYDNEFGITVTFSPNGNTIVIGEMMGDINGDPKSNVGTHDVYTNKNGSWVYNTTLVSADPVVDGGFYEKRVAFSFDGTVIAIGNYLDRIKADVINNIPEMTRAGTVDLYTIKNNVWTYTETLISRSPVANNHFGASIAFSPVDNVLVVSEPLGDIGNDPRNNVGFEQIFVKTINGWRYEATLSSKSQTPNGQFDDGKFSFDGQTFIAKERGVNRTNDLNCPSNAAIDVICNQTSINFFNLNKLVN